MAYDLTQIDRSSVTKLTRPVAELVASIAHGKRLHAFQLTVPGEDFCEFWGFEGIAFDVEQLPDISGKTDQLWIRDPGWKYIRIAGSPNLSSRILSLGVCRKAARKLVIKLQLTEPGKCHLYCQNCT